MSYNLLLIEDDPDDIVTLQGLLKASSTATQLTVEYTLQDGLARLSTSTPDLLLLDLSLPDSHGLKTFQQVHQLFPGLPTIVLTGHTDEELGVEAVKIGAQDFLTKDHLSGPLLVRSLRYAFERHHLTLLLQERRNEDERQALFRLSNKHDSPSTIDTAHDRILKDHSPALFHELKNRFIQTLRLALEERKYRGPSRVPSELGRIGDLLGDLHAAPRDVIHLYRDALAELTAATSAPEKSQAYIEEGRLLVLRLMGNVLTYYRHHHLNLSQSTASPEAPPFKTRLRESTTG